MNRQILSLALPTLATLIAEPLLVVVDSTLVGRLGDVPLAGLSLASTVLMTLVGICIFLSYATTASTARYFGANQPGKATRLGVDGLWLAAGLGAILALILYLFGPTILSWFGPTDAVRAEALSYLHASAWGMPGMLLVLAATGTVRGALEVKTPLVVATTGALANIPLSYLLIYPVGMGTAGAGLGTAIAQTLMGVTLGGAVVRLARKHGASLLPSGAGVLKSLHEATPLIIRTLCLRAGIILSTWAATSLGTTALASHQIVNSVWNFTAFGLDSLAIAAQVLVGQAMGSSNEARVRDVLRQCLVWGLGAGIALGLLLGLASPLIPSIMTTDTPVASLAQWGLVVCALAMPIGSLAFMLDGILIGAGDTRYLAWSMFASIALFAPIPLYLVAVGPGQQTGFIVLWAGYAGITMGVRAATLYARTRGRAWIVLGESR